ncbi:MAG: hypothetical protein ACREP8_04545, partial [Candidatus Binatia bacterium]
WEQASILLLALTHLFGFVFMALDLWQGRRAGLIKRSLPYLPAMLWFVGATAVGIIMRNPLGAGLGPGGQMTRAGEIFEDLFLKPGAALIHLGVFLLSILMLNPLLLAAVWASRRHWGPWVLGAAVITILLLPGPPFLRYALLLLPIAATIGVIEWSKRRPARRTVAAIMVFAGLSLPAGMVYLTSEFDPGSANDVPGRVDYASAAQRFRASGMRRVAGPAPTALAFYLVRDHGMALHDASKGPVRLRLDGGDRGGFEVFTLAPLGEIPKHLPPDTLLVVPTQWAGAVERMAASGFGDCGGVKGARLFAFPGSEACRHSFTK